MRRNRILKKCRLTGHEALPECAGTSDFLLWQLSDSAFPTGGFAHSSGLEAAWQNGEVRNRHELFSFIEASLSQLGRASLPFVTTAHAEPERLDEIDELCEAFTTNHVANRASRAQGKAFRTAVERVFLNGCKFPQGSKELINGSADGEIVKMPDLRFNHYPGVFGAVTRRLEISLQTVTQLFFFNQLRALLAAAVRLNIVGPMEAQVLQRKSTATCQSVIERCASLTLDDIAQTAPLLDIWQSTQDRLYSRLFQS